MPTFTHMSTHHSVISFFLFVCLFFFLKHVLQKIFQSSPQWGEQKAPACVFVSKNQYRRVFFQAPGNLIQRGLP